MGLRNPAPKRRKTRKPVQKQIPEEDLLHQWEIGKKVGREIATSKRRGKFLTWRHRQKSGRQPNQIQTIIEIVTELQRNGVNVPKIISVDKNNQIIKFESAGRSLADILVNYKYGPEKVRKKMVDTILAKASVMIGKMHRLGISHYHPRATNITIRGNKVFLVDFKFAMRKIVDWNSVEDIMLKFRNDYHWMKGYPKLYKKFLQRMIGQYPCSPEVKKALLKRVKMYILLFG